MALSINTNLMALTAFNNLTQSYGALSKSVQKLSSGLRINGAADDAAGLAVRELMRSDIAVLNQGVRNANDAISLLQTMDGAASVIDEKLIRMKELAEQAATGTYNSDQRTIMHAEFDAMRKEIDRIAEATDFNGIKLLNGVSGTTTGGLTHTEDLVSGTGAGASSDAAFLRVFQSSFGSVTDFSASTLNVSWTDTDGTLHNGVIDLGALGGGASGGTVSEVMTAIGALTSAGSSFNVSYVESTDASNPNGLDAIRFSDANGSGVSSLDVTLTIGGSSLSTATTTTGEAGQTVSDVKIHFGTGNDSNEDYYYIEATDMTTGTNGLDLASLSIASQASAQAALTTIDAAIIEKDTARAKFGATMNRLENTVTNLTIQAENISAAESQISDVDVAKEMTNFVNNQIKSQAAVAMLAQANTMPQMAMQLLGG